MVKGQTLKIREVLNPDFGKAFKRISNALHMYSPNWVEWVDGGEDISLIHVVGGGEYETLQNNPNRIVVQHCYETAYYDVIDWPSEWEKSILTVAFRDLSLVTNKKFNFCHTPWGAEETLFFNTGVEKDIDVFTTGHIASTENIDNVVGAAIMTGKVVYHTGEDFKYNRAHYKYLPYMSDTQYSAILNRAKYISCLREIEGFELAGVEGLFCGAVPIVPNLPTYDWYSGFAVKVDMKDNVLLQVADIISRDPKTLVNPDMNKAHELFDWKNIVANIFRDLEKYV